MAMHNPPHPGEVIRKLCIEPLGLSVTETAKGLGVSRKTLSKIINEHGSVTPDMALRLSRAFDTTPDLWITLQRNYDLYRASQNFDVNKVVKQIYSSTI